MTLELRPSLRQRQAECIREIRHLQKNLEEAAAKLELLKKKIDAINQEIPKNPQPENRSASENLLKELELVLNNEDAVQLKFNQKVTQYFWMLKGSKDRLARESYPNNLAEQEAFIADIDETLFLSINSEFIPTGKRYPPEEQVMEH